MWHLGNGVGKPTGVRAYTHTHTREIPIPIHPRVYVGVGMTFWLYGYCGYTTHARVCG